MHSATGPDVPAVLGALVLVLLAARLGGAVSERLRLPAVLGELAAGIVLGNLGHVGFHGFEGLVHDPTLDRLAQIGVLFLLFKVGLESDLATMAAVGRSAFLVAVLGVIAPTVLGFAAARAFHPESDPLVHWFVGATLCATSVGITARVLADLGRTASVEGRIILGAAVIDDVLGLLVLAVVTGAIAAADRGVAFAPTAVVWSLGKAVGFLVVALALGRQLSKHVFHFARHVPGSRTLLPLALAFCFGLAWVAHAAGLAPIVGAFAAGLILDEVHYEDLRQRDRRRRDVPELMAPLAALLVPLFFVLMGMRVDLGVFGDGSVLGFAAVLTVVAVASKQVCALGVFERGADRVAVGFGMIPRGEVGLIFAGIGAGLTLHGARVVDPVVYSAVIVMVSFTTLVTPPLLVWRMRRTPA